MADDRSGHGTPKNAHAPAEAVPHTAPRIERPVAQLRTDPASRAVAPPPKRKSPPKPREGSGYRELVETVVFVVVLVLLLKTFTAEAFVIPTGSMATTLWGYQKYVECPKCGYQFPVNCSDEVEAKGGQPPVPVVGCTCPNCRFNFKFEEAAINPTCNSGDRVLVAKYMYDLVTNPHRLDVVVFKYPRAPEQDQSPTNYIKRLIGLPGETIGIHYGKLYVMDPAHSKKYDDHDVAENDLWDRTKLVMHEDDAREQLESGDPNFKIVRKPPDKVMALRRIVYDNDHPASDLIGSDYERWRGDGNTWKPTANHGFEHAGGQANGIDWLRYHNVLRRQPGETGEVKPELITDFIGYNGYETLHGLPHGVSKDWVGDLMIECKATVKQPEGGLVFELSKGIDRFQARVDLASGKCTLFRVTGKKEEELGSADTPIKKAGSYDVRFANVDERLLMWVNKSLPFGDGVNYPAPSQRGPTQENDLQPASIGLQGADVAIESLQLWRDTYYTLKPPDSDYTLSDSDWSDPGAWSPLRSLPARTLYVQPNPRHYLCLGDNSPQSSDGREWGLVPERLLLGRALFVYYPFKFDVWPLYSPVNRVGPIR
jgi:signal peptidase I